MIINYKKLLDELPLFIFVRNAEGDKIEFYNKAVYNFLGKAKEDVDMSIGHGSVWTPYMHPDDAERVYPYIDEALRNKQPYEVEVRIKDTNGEYRWFLSRCRPVYGIHNQIEAWIGSAVDITMSKVWSKESSQMYKRRLDERTEKLKQLAEELGGWGP